MKNIGYTIAGFFLGIILMVGLSLSGLNASQFVNLRKADAPDLQASSPPVSEESLKMEGSLFDSPRLRELYFSASPGVVSIYVNQVGLQSQSGAGSGFVYDDEGHIVTNNHVVQGADLIVVDFANGFQSTAEITGTDDDSDLAVIQADQVPEEAQPLPLGDVEEVDVGEWVVAIGNPFGLNTSMTLGITSAKGRTIPSGATPFSIPQAIQIDAAVNPGNSGGPLLDLDGNVIGVNAQIASSGARVNAGVAFAIPISVVKQVVPSLIAEGEYQWPWLGIRGSSVNLFLQEANDLESQKGAYIVEVVPDSPAAEAGLEGATDTASVSGLEVPVGGDVITAADGEPLDHFNELLIAISNSEVDGKLNLTILRDGDEQDIQVDLMPRPEAFGQ